MDCLYDMHCHLDFADDEINVAKNSKDLQIEAITSTVMPSSYVGAKGKFSDFDNIRTALGMHPWWIADGRVTEADISRFCTLCPETSFIGEIGLDLHGKFKLSHDRQVLCLLRLIGAIKESADSKIIFFHAVKSADELMSIIQEHGLLENNICVMHSFSGTPNEFGRAISLGFYFSVGMRMLGNKQGLEFARAIPDELLFLETDAPAHEGSDWDAGTWRQELENVAKGLAEVRGVSYTEISELTSTNARSVLSSIA